MKEKSKQMIERGEWATNKLTILKRKINDCVNIMKLEKITTNSLVDLCWPSNFVIREQMDKVSGPEMTKNRSK